MQTPGTAHLTRLTHGLREGVVGHFVPHEKNGYLPHVLKHRVLTGYSAIAVLLKALLILAPTILPVAAVYSSSVTPANIIALTNVARGKLKIGSLKEEPKLDAAAAGKAADIMGKQYFAHVSPEGKTPWDWIRGAGYSYRYAGENLALHYFTAEGVHDAWMASPMHRQNIIDKRYVDIGVAVQQGTYEGYDTVVVVQMFGTPKTMAAVPAGGFVLPNVPASAPRKSAPVVPADVIPLPEQGSDVTPTAAPDTVVPDAPVVEPAPADAPETPATEAPAPEASAPEAPASAEPQPEETPLVILSSVKVLPTPNGYNVAVLAPDAVDVQAYLGSDSVTLARGVNGGWTGDLQPKTKLTDADYLFLGALDKAGKRTYGPVAMVMPESPAADVYGGTGERSDAYKLFGFLQVDGLEDAVRRFYLIGLILLCGALAVKILVKIRIQHPTVIAHSLLVIGLFAVLLKF